MVYTEFEQKKQSLRGDNIAVEFANAFAIVLHILGTDRDRWFI